MPKSYATYDPTISGDMELKVIYCKTESCLVREPESGAGINLSRLMIFQKSITKIIILYFSSAGTLSNIELN